jgi:hypothetical protein
MSIYRNRLIINQRGGAISIDNTTDKENVQISHRSGSNINLNGVVTSELATNNKQVAVVNDSFETVGNDKSSYTAKDLIARVGETSYTIKGLKTNSEITAMENWKSTYYPISLLNAKFKIKRGGSSYPNGESNEPSGERTTNPVIGSKVYTVENKFSQYSGVPVRASYLDDVVAYAKVPDKGTTTPAAERPITEEDISKSAGPTGSNAPGVLEFGAAKCGATEGGLWDNDEEAQKINEEILNTQFELAAFEQSMGNGGDEISFVKRNKIEQIGAVFNDYPSVKIDDKGRSQPFEMLVSDTGTYKNHDYIPHVEDVDNSSNFPCGDDTKIVSNKYNLTVGSGGINAKTTGPVEVGGSTLKVGFKKININASHGVHIGSENGIEIQSVKTITLRSNRQIYVESSLGIKNNLIVGGGAMIEGETYLQHVTAPLEVQQTQDTILLGKFATDQNRRLRIGEAQVGGAWYPVYAIANDDLILNYPHSHHFNNLPLRLARSNKDVRKLAQSENINNHKNISQALAQNHERKLPTEG